MSRKRIFEAWVLPVTIAYAVTKAIANFQCSDEVEALEDNWDDYFSDSS